MKKVIKLNNEISVDLEKLIEGGMVILANSGGGKSYLIRRIAEQAVANVQVIIIDPEGEFSSLREKYDFILAGKNADVPAEPRSAALLATKLLEINKSAVIDLYELHPQERQRFVKLFCDALVNAPKELYHPVLIILDEAHEYVPEGKPSEATWAVELLASKGRKRGQRLILASQRIAKISKNVTAEANNKLIGRASQDIDMKRAGDELGFDKEGLKQLRQLKPGEFFAFGPAISDEVVKLKVGEVKTAHAKVGYTGVGKVPPASDVIKKVLAELKDLPQEAEKEAKTVQEFKAQITQLKRELAEKTTGKGWDKEAIVKQHLETVEKTSKLVRDQADREWNKKMFDLRNEYLKQVQNWFKIIQGIGESMKDHIDEKDKYTFKAKLSGDSVNGLKTTFEFPKKEGEWELKSHGLNTRQTTFKNLSSEPRRPITRTDLKKFTKEMSDSADLNLGFGEIKVLNAIAQYPDGMTTQHLAVLTGYKLTSRAVYTQKLAQKGFIEKTPNGFVATPAGIEALGSNFTPLPEGAELREYLLKTLPDGERRVFEAIISGASNKEDIMFSTGYKSTSTAVYVQRLVARKAVISDRGVVRINEKLL